MHFWVENRFWCFPTQTISSDDKYYFPAMISQNKSAKRTQNISQRLAELLEIFLNTWNFAFGLIFAKEKTFSNNPKSGRFCCSFA